MIVILLALYFIPALVAAVRGHHQTIPIGILNLFFGWTLVGWVAALIWAKYPPCRAAPVRSATPIGNARTAPR